jgi:hypothetical protein
LNFPDLDPEPATPDETEPNRVIRTPPPSVLAVAGGVNLQYKAYTHLASLTLAPIAFLGNQVTRFRHFSQSPYQLFMRLLFARTQAP